MFEMHVEIKLTDCDMSRITFENPTAASTSACTMTNGKRKYITWFED